MTPTEELQALNYAIARLESELKRPLPDDRRKSIAETLEVIRSMLAAIEAEIGPRRIQ